MRIFDTFLFDGEVDLLAHRFAEIGDLVDGFVVVEAGTTFQGAPKPMLFAGHIPRFAAFAPRIRHITLASLGGGDRSPWAREAMQRNAIMLGLTGAAPEDVVLVLDADEIPSRAVLTRLRAEGLAMPTRLALSRHYEFVEHLAPASTCCAMPRAPFANHWPNMVPGRWGDLTREWMDNTAIAVRYGDLTGDADACLPPRSAYDLRRGAHECPCWANAGRHLVCIDPSTAPERKLARVSHAEFADARGTGAEHLARTRRMAVHHRGWWYAQPAQGPLPEDLARLRAFAPDLPHAPKLPAMWRRRLVRCWAWARLAAWLPDGLVRRIDRHFEALLPLLIVPLAVAALWRRIAVRLRRSRPNPPQPQAHYHG